jgi:hypothetical protein
MWARHDMANVDGRMQKTLKNGLWEISDTGRAWLKDAVSSAVAQSPSSMPVNELDRKRKATAAESTRADVDASKRHVVGRNCSRRMAWRGYDIPRARPPRGMATPKGFDVSLWTERVGKGCPTFAVCDAYNVNQVRTNGIKHTPMRSLCVSGVAVAAKGQGDFDPAAPHTFVIHGDDTFIVW